MVYLKIKRLIDIVLSGLGLIILAPVFLLLIIAIKLGSPGPVLFKQKRVGIHKSHFNILKFRTMRIDTPKDCPTHLLLFAKLFDGSFFNLIDAEYLILHGCRQIS